MLCTDMSTHKINITSNILMRLGHWANTEKNSGLWLPQQKILCIMAGVHESKGLQTRWATDNVEVIYGTKWCMHPSHNPIKICALVVPITFIRSLFVEFMFFIRKFPGWWTQQEWPTQPVIASTSRTYTNWFLLSFHYANASSIK